MFRRFLILSFIAFFAVNSAAAQNNWSAFWQKFKTAVVKGDRQTVFSLSDSNMTDAMFKGLFGMKSSKNCFAKAKPVKDEADGYSVFCGEQGYYFKKIGGKYKFAEGFAND